MSNHATSEHEEHAHGHPVMGWKLQLGVLGALLFFTLATVLFYNIETWADKAFEITLPGWINVVGAMSIATVKAILVCMYFMGLRYDKALNTFAMLFCLFCVGLFLAFSMIDLQTRDRVYDWKKDEIVAGGTGKGLDSPARDPNFASAVVDPINTGGLSIVEFRRQQGIEEEGSEKAFWKYYYKKGHAYHRHSADTSNYFDKLGYGHGEELSSANRSIPRAGITPGLFNALDPNDHSAEHSDDHSDDHGSDH